MNRREFLIGGAAMVGVWCLLSVGAEAMAPRQEREALPGARGPHSLRGSSRTHCAHRGDNLAPWDSLVPDHGYS
jgi:hypothetical protein